MRRKLLKIWNHRITVPIVLTVIILIQILYVADFAINGKQIYHSDEVYSYGLANSFYQPFINSNVVYENPENYINVDEWIDGSVLREYITVQEGEQFRYDSVWYNQKQDRHPPLYYAIIHTVSSFMPNVFSPVIGYIINFICFAVMQIYLYKLSKGILKSKWLAVLVCFAFGFSSGSINNMIFIRMYSMLTMFMVMFVYVHRKTALWVLAHPIKDKNMSANLPKSFIISLLLLTAAGALTQHIFLILAFVTAVFFCIWLLFEKRIKLFLQYGFTLLGGAVLSVLIFPATIEHFLAEDRYMNIEAFLHQIHISIRYLFSNTFQMSSSLLILFLTYILTAVILAVIFAIPMIYLFRDKVKPMKRLRIFRKKIVRYWKKQNLNRKNMTWQKFIHRIRQADPTVLLMLILCIMLTLIISYTIPFFDITVLERYYYIIFAVLFILIVSLVFFLLSGTKYRKRILAVLLCIFSVHIIAYSDFSYIYYHQGTIQKEFSDMMSHSSVLIISGKDELDKCMINLFPTEMYDVDKVCMTSINSLDKCKEKLMELDGKCDYLMMSEERFSSEEENLKIDKEIISRLKEIGLIQQADYIGNHFIYVTNYKVYRCT